jgi:hypothetical protein
VFDIAYAIDGGAAQTLFSVRADEAASQTYTLAGGAVVTLDDPFVEQSTGTVLSNILQTFSADLAGAGSTLTLTAVGSGDGGFEAIAVQNIVVEGVSAAPMVLINEFRPNPTGSDPASGELFEILGVAGAAFDGALVFIEGDPGGSNPGDVNNIVSVSGVFDANGLLTVDTGDVENPSFTVALVSAFSGDEDTDIDADDDGVIDDISIFGTVYDAIGTPDDSSASTLLYGAQLGGADFAYTGDEPRLIFRDSANRDLYAVNDPDGGQVFDVSAVAVAATAFDVDPTAADSFGSANPAFVGDNGGGFADVKIHDVQGTTDLADGTLVGVAGAADESPLLGQAVRVQGVVTMLLPALGGFYVQEEDADADADAATSEGVFVASSETVAKGQIVTVEGVAQEVEGETRIAASGVSVDDAGDNSALVTPTVVTFPTATVLQDADGDYVANLEAYEGMLVTVPTEMSVTELFQLDRFGTIRLSSDGRLEQFTQSNAPSVAGYAQHLKDVAARSLVLDDGTNLQNPDPLLVPGLGADGSWTGATSSAWATSIPA